MHRRDAFATAGAITAVAAAAVIGFGTNVGLFGLTGANTGPGGFPLVAEAKASATPNPIADVQVVDLPVATPAPASGSTRTSPAQPASGSTRSQATQASPAASAPTAPAASAPAVSAPAASAPAVSAPAPAPSISAPTVSPPGNVGASPAPSFGGGEGADD